MGAALTGQALASLRPHRFAQTGWTEVQQSGVPKDA
jgi:hypothetical protein